MIISISGGSNQSIGQGKDTVGRIIQYLFWKKRVETESYNYHTTLSDFLRPSFNGNVISGWEVKKFAELPKSIVCLLTGCKRADLENEDFKNQEIGSDWVKYIVSYGDAYDSYTRTFTSKLDAEHHAEKMFMENYIVNKIEDVKLTYRMLLQLLGTEAGRDIIHPNIWVNSLMQDYKEQRYQYKNDEWNQGYSAYPNWIITDTRFPNEYKAVKDRNGLCIRVTRTYENACKNIQDIYAHSSETALSNHTFDWEIQNDGTIDELVTKVEEFLKHFKLID